MPILLPSYCTLKYYEGHLVREQDASPILLSHIDDIIIPLQVNLIGGSWWPPPISLWSERPVASVAWDHMVAKGATCNDRSR